MIRDKGVSIMKNVINKNTAVNLMTTIPLILDKPSRISHIENDHHLKFELLALKGIPAYTGRSFEHGVIPQAPKDYAYDLLTAQIIESDIFYLNIFPNVAGSFDFKLIFSNGEFFEITLDVNAKEPKIHNDFSFNIWQYPYSTARYYNLEPFSKEHDAITVEHLSLYFRSGGRTLSMSIVEDPWNHQTYDAYPSMIKWTHLGDDLFSFDFSDFDHYLTLANSVGDFEEIFCFSILPWENRIFYYEKDNYISENLVPGSQRWTTIWQQFLDAFTQHTKDLKVFDKIFIAVDERSEEEVIHALTLLSNQKDKFKIHAALNYSSANQEIIDVIDDLSVDMSQVDQDIHDAIKHRKNKGLKTTLYTCAGDFPNSHAFSHPFETDWTIFYAFALGFDGYMRWALDAWVEDPLDDLSHWYWESGDPFLIYPSKNRTPEKSIRYIHFENALQAIRLLDETDRKVVLEMMVMPQHRIDAFGVKVALNQSELEKITKTVKAIYKYIDQKYFK